MNNIEQKIEVYLADLAAALSGEDAALVQDALYDAEHHFRAALADNTKDERSIEMIVEQYGTVEEISAQYCALEASVAFALHGESNLAVSSKGGQFFHILKDAKAYQALAFNFLSLPIAIAYFAWTILFGVVSAVASAFVIGAPFFLLHLQSMRYFSLFEGRLIEALLGERMPRRPTYIVRDENQSLMQQITILVRDRRVWTSLVYLALKLPLSFATFFLNVIPAVTSVALILTPIIDPILHAIEPSFTVDLELVWLPLTLPVGLIGFVLSLYLTRYIAPLQARFAKYMLVTPTG